VLVVSGYRQGGTVLTDHTFSVPLDHDRPEGERIEIFAREIATAALCWTACSRRPAARPDGTPEAGDRSGRGRARRLRL
jgi:hypothetical protein